MTEEHRQAATPDRLSRRGTLTITAKDGVYAVTFKASGPYRGRAWCTTDEADLWEHCHLGASDWHDEGNDLAALLTECEQVTRPRERSVNELAWAITCRRASRVYGPPLPSYMRWRGWNPGHDRWLRTFAHSHEYLAGYLRDVEIEREFDTEQTHARERRRVASNA